jgi:hypothetical protein
MPQFLADLANLPGSDNSRAIQAVWCHTSTIDPDNAPGKLCVPHRTKPALCRETFNGGSPTNVAWRAQRPNRTSQLQHQNRMGQIEDAFAACGSPSSGNVLYTLLVCDWTSSVPSIFHAIFGIDLGTSSLSIAIVSGPRQLPEAIKDSDQSSIPSFVDIGAGGCTFGVSAPLIPSRHEAISWPPFR